MLFGWLYSQLFPEPADDTKREPRSSPKAAKIQDSAKPTATVKEDHVELLDQNDSEDVKLLRVKVDEISRLSHNPKLRSALKIVKQQVFPLIGKAGKARAVDDILTNELEELDCVDTSSLADMEKTGFRSARKEFAALCHSIDAAMPQDPHSRPVNAEESTKKKKRRKRA